MGQPAGRRDETDPRCAYAAAQAGARVDGWDLRLLLSQQVGVEVLAPQAIRVLRHDPLAEGDYYPGDLLVAVMKLPSSYWAAHPDELATTQRIARSVEDADAELLGDINRFLARTADCT